MKAKCVRSVDGLTLGETYTVLALALYSGQMHAYILDDLHSAYDDMPLPIAYNCIYLEISSQGIPEGYSITVAKNPADALIYPTEWILDVERDPPNGIIDGENQAYRQLKRLLERLGT